MTVQNSDSFEKANWINTFIQRYGLLLIFIVFAVVLSFLSDRFLTTKNILNILRQASINGIISVGMTLVILTGGVDLSVGSILALSGVIGADLMKRGLPVPVVILTALLIGVALGTINGIAISSAKIPPFIATLGMLVVARGLTLMYTQGQPITGLPESFRFMGTGSIGPIPMPIIIAGAAFLLGIIVLSRTRFGEYVYLTGDNPTAARLAGVPNRRVIVMVYAISGFCATLGGLMLIARLDSAQPVIGVGYEFSAIAAVVVGGTSFIGGEGTLVGTIFGALLMQTLNNGLTLLNVSSLWEQVYRGGLIAVAVLFYKTISRSSK